MVKRVKGRKYRDNSREMLGIEECAAGQRRRLREKNLVKREGKFAAALPILLKRWTSFGLPGGIATLRVRTRWRSRACRRSWRRGRATRAASSAICWPRWIMRLSMGWIGTRPRLREELCFAARGALFASMRFRMRADT